MPMGLTAARRVAVPKALVKSFDTPPMCTRLLRGGGRAPLLCTQRLVDGRLGGVECSHMGNDDFPARSSPPALSTPPLNHLLPTSAPIPSSCSQPFPSFSPPLPAFSPSPPTFVLPRPPTRPSPWQACCSCSSFLCRVAYWHASMSDTTPCALPSARLRCDRGGLDSGAGGGGAADCHTGRRRLNDAAALLSAHTQGPHCGRRSGGGPRIVGQPRARERYVDHSGPVILLHDHNCGVVYGFSLLWCRDGSYLRSEGGRAVRGSRLEHSPNDQWHHHVFFASMLIVLTACEIGHGED